MKIRKKRTRVSERRHNEYLNYIDSIMKSGIVETRRIQNLLNLSYDVNISKRSIRRFRAELQKKPLKKPCNAVARVEKDVDIECLKQKQKAIDKPVILLKDKIPIRIQCPKCKRMLDIPKQENMSVGCMQCHYVFNKKTGKMEKESPSLYQRVSAIF